MGSLTLRPWRVLGCLYILPGVVAFLLLLLLPESPKFLLMIGETKRGLDTMEWISRKNTGRTLSEDQMKRLLAYQEHVQVKRRKEHQNFFRSMLDDAMPRSEALRRLFHVRLHGYVRPRAAVSIG